MVENYKEGIKPKTLERSEKLEDILKAQREEEYLKKNNISKSEQDAKNSKKKKLNLDELLTNFNQVEKLSNLRIMNGIVLNVKRCNSLIKKSKYIL